MKLFTKPFTKQQTQCQHKILSRGVRFTIKAALLTLCCSAFISCSKNPQTVVIWTNLSEFASYAEYFNKTHNDTKALVIYKEEPISALPPADDQLIPDIIVGSWLKNSTTKKNFKALNSLFNNEIEKDDFYESILTYGEINERQYLLPVSFNLPLMMVAHTNEDMVPTSHLLTLDQIKDAATKFNTPNKYNAYASMGYAPSWDIDFIYEATKLMGVNYTESGKSFSWNQEALNKTVRFLRNWTESGNTNTTAEQNFQFKYLFSAKYKQVTSGRCLFAYSTSDKFFTLSDEQASSLSFRWLSEGDKIHVQDDIISMGIYKHAKHTSAAQTFISWFENYDTQKELMERTKGMNLDSNTFGIANGFSAIRSVNEKVYPIYYRSLLENLPGKDHLKLPNSLPFIWNDLKDNIIEKFLTENTNTEINLNDAKTMEEDIQEWNKEYF